MFRVKCKVPVGVHVVQVTPDGLKRDIVRPVLINHFSKLARVSVAIAALVPAEGPARYKKWLADYELVISNHIIWRLSHGVDEHDLADAASAYHVVVDDASG